MWGGKRSDSGRNKRGTVKKTDWNLYKKEAKLKKLKEAAKSTKNLKNFFLTKDASTDQSSNDDGVTGGKEGYDVMEEACVEKVQEGNHCQNEETDEATKDDPLQVPSPLPFFKNGCKAPGMRTFFLLLFLK